MKRVVKGLIIVFILLIGHNVYALDIGKTEELKFSSNNTNQAIGNSDTIVFYDSYDVYYYNMEKNTLTNIYASNTSISKVFVRGTTAYVWEAVKYDNSQGYIHEVNILTGKEISSANIKREYVINDSFAVDLKGNYYFESNKIIDIYNKKGEKINSVTAKYDISSFNSFSPNDEYLFVDYGYYNEAILKLENGELKSGDMYYYYNRMPEWKFASDGKTAINQFGEIALFDFTNLSKPYALQAEAVSSGRYYSYPAFYETSDKLYIPDNKGYIIGVSKTDFKKKDKYLIKENSYVVAMKYANSSLYVLYRLDDKFYETRLDLSKNNIKPKNTVLSTHTTLSHTQAQIKTKYEAAKPKADYTNRYKNEPSKVAPYYEGTLKDDIVQDTVNQLNYYRYLAGLNSVTLNTEKQARSQKGALIQAVNETLTHYPAKPSDMDQDFYKEAYAGCNASYASGDTYSGNVSYNVRIDKAPGNFIDDNNNAMGGVGHRNSMLDPFAKKVSFGNVSPYVAMSIYYDDTNPNKDLFYAWPPAGYFPAENMYQKEMTMWSIWLDKSIKVQSDSIIKLTYKNKDYVIPRNWTIFDNIDNVVAYYIPTEIRKEIVGNTNRYINGETVHVNISNLSDKDINTYEIDYDVKFFNAETVALESISVITYKEGSNLGSVYSPNGTVNLTVGDVYEIISSTTPSDATVGKYTYKIADTSIATISDDKITPKKGGNTTLTLTDSYTKKTFTYKLKVYEKPSKVYFKTTSVSIKKGERYTLPQIVIEPSTAIVENGIYSSSDTSIAYISNGQVVGSKAGTVTITYKDTWHSDAPVATLTVTVTNDDIKPVTSLTFGNTSMALEVGKTSSINAIISPTDATTKTITWTSSNTSVATVSNGKVTGVKAGEATITGKTNNGKTATCKVVVSDKVVQVTGISVNKNTLSLEVGQSETLKATITPTNATVKQAVWTSRNTSVATVDSNGKITAVKEGTAEIVASAGNISVISRVTVTEKTVAVTSVTLNKTTLSLEEGKTETLTATIAPTNATTKTVTWTSSNTSVAKVDSSGKVTAVKAGTATITAKSNNGKTVTCKLTVTAKKVEVTGVTLNKTTLSLEEGKTETLKATIAPTNATDKTVTWTSSNTSVAKVDSNGKVTAVKAGEATITAKSNNGKTVTCKLTVTKPKTKVSYTTHVQDIGWQNYTSNGNMAGTSGKSLRLEGIKIKLENQEYSGNVLYRTHIQDIGWETNFKKNDDMSGTSHQSKRLEAIEIKLDGDIAKYYDIYYRVHAQNFGWMGWAKNGEQAGTAGYSNRLEGIEIVLVEKGKNPPTRTDTRTKEQFAKKQVEYKTHIQDIGWQDKVADGKVSGTSHQSKRLEGITISLYKQAYTGNIEYRTHIQDIGWEKTYKKNGDMSGTSGQSKRLEAIQIRLTGEMATHYDIYYRVHAQEFGWMGWAKNGEQAGTAHYSYRLEAIEIVLVEKGKSPPTRTDTKTQKAFMEKK